VKTILILIGVVAVVYIITKTNRRNRQRLAQRRGRRLAVISALLSERASKSGLM